MDKSQENSPTLVDSFRLVPVIEIEPFPYMAKGRSYPADSSAASDPAAWAAYWRESLADSNIEGVVPIRDGSWLVPTESFKEETQEVLEAVLSGLWKHHKVEVTDISSAGFSGGGIVLMDHEGTIWLQPSCCGDLGSLKDWGGLVSSPPESWNMLWIGHPWVYARHEGGRIIFSDQTESNDPAEEVFTVPLARLKSELALAHQELIRFSSHVESAMTAYGYSGDVTRTVKQFCGVAENFPFS
jgi:hypothetical protein